ncbi:MAG: 50S ribosomal protein L32e [Candidatus Aenigmatarchaeota archaeon]|nr:MAG: 50S ribosomal protein L32e [Candidatus Aenigmarchaeota archaeon]
MRKKPKFKRQLWKLKRLKDVWRRPRGRHSKQRRYVKFKGRMPDPGFGSPNKGRHPSGYWEVMVHNPKDLEKIDKEKEAARIGSSVGLKKRLEILKKAEELGIKVLNPGLIKEKLEKRAKIDYNEILSGSVSEVKGKVEKLSDLDFRKLLEMEKKGKNRKSLVEYFEKRLG